MCSGSPSQQRAFHLTTLSSSPFGPSLLFSTQQLGVLRTFELASSDKLSLQISVPAKAFQGDGGGNVKIERDSNTFARLLEANSPLSKRDIICGYMKML